MSELIVAKWRHMASDILVNIGSNNSLSLVTCQTISWKIMVSGQLDNEVHISMKCPLEFKGFYSCRVPNAGHFYRHQYVIFEADKAGAEKYKRP